MAQTGVLELLVARLKKYGDPIQMAEVIRSEMDFSNVIRVRFDIGEMSFYCSYQIDAMVSDAMISDLCNRVYDQFIKQIKHKSNEVFEDSDDDEVLKTPEELEAHEYLIRNGL